MIYPAYPAACNLVYPVISIFNKIDKVASGRISRIDIFEVTDCQLYKLKIQIKNDDLSFGFSCQSQSFDCSLDFKGV